MTTKALEVLNRRTGEAIAVADEATDQLVVFLEDADAVTQEIHDGVAVVEAELLSRMDKAGTWTHRVRVTADREYELTAASPTAGTVSYDAAVLETELRALIDRDVIDDVAAAKAVKRTVSATFTIPFGVDLDDAVKDVRVFADANEWPVDAAPARSANKAGINALEKIASKCRTAVKRATVKHPAGKRSVRFKVKTKDRR